MSAINVTPDKKTAVGFTDLSVKPPKNYFLIVGDSADGWTVKSADYDEEIAVIEKDGVAITLKLGQGLVEQPAATAAAAPAPAPPPAASAALPRPAAAAAVPPPPGALPAGLTSYRDRLHAREQQEQQARSVAEKKQRETFVELARKVAQQQIDQARAVDADGQPAPAAAEAPAPQEQPAQDGNVQ